MKFRRIGKPFFLTTTVVLGSLHIGNMVGTDDNFRVKHVVVSGNHFLTLAQYNLQPFALIMGK